MTYIGNEEYKRLQEIKDTKEATQKMREIMKEFHTIPRWYFYIFTSHNLWHIFINCMVFAVLLASRSYLHWRADNKC